MALGRRRRPLPRPVPRNPVPLRYRPAHRPLVLHRPSACATAASARASTSASACRTATPIPEDLRAHVAAGIQQAVEAAVIRMAGREGRNLCLAGGLGLNALLVSALENRSGYENVFVQPAAGNAGTAIGAVLEAWHGAFRQDRRVPLRHALPGPRLLRAGDQAGARKLQAALPLPGHDRRGDRYRRGAVERQQDRRLDARPHGVRRRARSAIAAFWPRRSTPTPPRT